MTDSVNTEITFDSVLVETQAARRKSDLTNLAHAYVELAQGIEEGKVLLQAIEKAARSPNTPIIEVKRLYDKAHSFGFHQEIRKRY